MVEEEEVERTAEEEEEDATVSFCEELEEVVEEGLERNGEGILGKAKEKDFCGKLEIDK